MAGRERRRSSAASLELSAASRVDWVAAGKSASLIAARASSVNLISAPSVPINPSISDLICSICALVVVKNFRESALRPGNWLSRTMRSTLVKNRSLRSRLSGILPTISLRVSSVASARSKTAGSRSCTVARHRRY